MGQGQADSIGLIAPLNKLTNTPTCTLLAFVLGVVCIRLLPRLPPEYVAIALTVIAMGMLWYGLRRNRLVRIPAGFLLGFTWALWAAVSTMADWLSPKLEKQDLVITGDVVGPVIQRTRGGRFDFSIKSAELGGQPVVTPSLVRLTAYDEDLVPRDGGKWQLMVRLKRPRGLFNFGAAFQYETWLFQAGIGATGYVVRGSPVTSEADMGLAAGTKRVVERIRTAYPTFLQFHVPNARNAAVLSALTVGRREGLNKADWALLRDTGTAHLVAISGLHIGLLAVLAASAVSWLDLPCRPGVRCVCCWSVCLRCWHGDWRTFRTCYRWRWH